MRHLVCLLVLAATVSAGDVWSPQPGITVRPDGRLQAGGLSLVPTHYDGTWRATTSEKAVGAIGARTGASWRLAGPWMTAAGPATVEQTVAVHDGGVVVAATLTGAPSTNAFALSISLDGDGYRGTGLRVDGAALPLPVESPTSAVRAAAPAGSVSIPLPAGGWLDITGDLRVLVQDNLSWKTDSFTVRILADGAGRVAATLKLRASAIAPLPLGAAAATPRRDDDGKGWTGQGDNDLRILANGRLPSSRIPFDVVDGAIVLSRDRVPGRPAEVSVAAAGRRGACLYLLHAIAWAPKPSTPVGTVRLHRQDGSSEEVVVTRGTDVDNWWNPSERLPNAVCAWAADNPHARVGLFISRHPVADQPLERISLSVVPGTAWMVVGMALGEDGPLPAQAPDIITEDSRWRPAEVTWETVAGSALDLSWMNDGPVAVRIIPRGADLVRADRPEVPVRLLGANLCFTANFPEKPLAERMARAMRALGYNAVRIHHHDGGLARAEGDGTSPDPEKLDRLEYLVARCKGEGLWVTTDVYVSRKLPRGSIPELADREWGQEFKAMLPILPSAMDNWKRWAGNHLGHRNPYTGLTWAEDPALMLLGLTNEDNLTTTVNRDPRIRAMYEERFTAHLATRPAAEREGAAREAAFRAWLAGLQAASYIAMRDHVRSLGVTAPTVSCSMQQEWWTIAARDGMDMVDNHAYHDHPNFPVRPWSLPFGHNQRSPLAEMLATPTRLAQSRRLDRPFTVTELNYVLPNHHRGQYAAGVAAVAGLQGWSGIWRFAFAHDIKLLQESGPASGFDLVRDPIAMLSERAMALLWRRGDVVPAKPAAALVYDPAVAAASPGAPNALAALALHMRVGNLPAATAQTAAVPGLACLLQSAQGGSAPAGRLPVLPFDDDPAAALAKAGLIPAGAVDLAARTASSATGQIALDAKAGILTVATPCSVAAVLPGGGTASPGGIAIANPDADEATVVVAALDGDLARGRKLLVLHLTDAQNSGIRFGSRRHTLVEAWGAAPMLVRAGRVTVDLPSATAATAWALDLAGNRKEQVPLAVVDGRIRLDASVVRAWGPCLAWEIVRQ